MSPHAPPFLKCLEPQVDDGLKTLRQGLRLRGAERQCTQRRDSSICHRCQGPWGWAEPGVSKFSSQRDSSKNQPSSRTLGGERRLRSARSRAEAMPCLRGSARRMAAKRRQSHSCFWGVNPRVICTVVSRPTFSRPSLTWLKFKSLLGHKPVFLQKALHWSIQTLVGLTVFTPTPTGETIRWEAAMF